ncbi:MAG: endonuclease domain-containing protein [Patescibacteria group bacterium]
MVKFTYNQPIFKYRRRELRRNQTKSEKILWQQVRANKLGCRFWRQYSVGPYILDFYCPALRLCIELDGELHQEKENKLYDQDRDAYLKEHDIIVLRFKNEEVESRLGATISKIMTYLPKTPLA